MPRPIPLLLEIPRRALARRDLVPALVYRALRPARTDMARVVECFALCDDELGFARALLDKRSQHHLFRSNQRAFCGDFVVVDVSSPEVARRRAVVLDLKQGAPLRVGGGGAGVQLRNADQAVRDLARSSGALGDEAPFEVLTGDTREVLAFFGVTSP
jgi:hypothetical protein